MTRVTDRMQDKRFNKVNARGFSVFVAYDELKHMVTDDVMASGYVYQVKLTPEIKSWLLSRGKFRHDSLSIDSVTRNKGATFYFARESTAMEFKLAYT